MTVKLIKFIFVVGLIASFSSATASAQQPVQASLSDQAVPTTPATVAPTAQPAATVQNYFDAGCNSCGDACGGSCNACCDSGIFGRGLIKRSDRAFDNFISPMTNPIFFEDPRSLTEAHAFFMQHRVPQAAGGGSVQVYAVQLRARLNDYVSLIATKDGYITSSNAFVNDGWADLSAGLKFNLVRDVANQRLVSAGFTFELPTGEADPLQGNGDGELNLFLTGGKQLGCRAHWLSATGIRVPMNNTDESQSMYWSNHLDYQVRRGVYLLSETNWYHWTRAGVDGPLPGLEGLDLINLGNPGVSGNDIVTTAAGIKFKRNGKNEIGFAFEFPLTERRDIIDNRITADWNIRY